MEQDEDQGAGRPAAAVVALVVIVLLVLGGLWLTRHLAATARLQDCVASGRSNCAPIEAR